MIPQRAVAQPMLGLFITPAVLGLIAFTIVAGLTPRSN
jgi:hypothetical protein